MMKKSVLGKTVLFPIVPRAVCLALAVRFIITKLAFKISETCKFGVSSGAFLSA